jgi:glycosyltransferase involved in cell wall biosynthesis
MRTLKITHFSPGGLRGRGGIGRFIAYLIPALQREDPALSCRVVDTYGPGPFVLMPFWFAAALFQLVWQASWKQIDLAHIHMAAFGSVVRKLVLVVVASQLRIPVLLHLHGADMVEFVETLSPFWRRLLCRWLNQATVLAVIGQYWYEYVTGTLGIPKDRVVIIHNGVPDPVCTAMDSIGAIKTNGRDCQLLALGELGSRKGTPEILTALASSVLRPRPWFAILAGNGPVADYRLEIERLGLTDRINLPGWVESEQAWRLLSQSDVLLLPSRLEGLPVAILEAMAAGVVVITTPVGAIPDAIVDGETGLLVPVGDALALGAAIAKLIDDPVLRIQLAGSARQRFKERFTIERTADQISKLYRRLIVGHSRVN